MAIDAAEAKNWALLVARVTDDPEGERRCIFDIMRLGSRLSSKPHEAADAALHH